MQYNSLLDTTAQSKTQRLSAHLPKISASKLSINHSLPALHQPATTKRTHTQRLRLPNINLPYFSIDEHKQQAINKLTFLGQSLIDALPSRNYDIAKSSLQELVYLSFSLQNLHLFIQSLDLLADIYVQDDDFDNAIYTQNQLRQIANITQDHKLKIHILIQLALTCKILHRFGESLTFLRKALQYVWLTEDYESEFSIYDKMGLIYFLTGEVKKAKEFHERSMNCLQETNESPVKIHGIDSLQKYLKTILYRTQSLDKMLLAKLGMIGNQKSYDEKDFIIKFTTQLDYDQQIKFILGEDEFYAKIGTPDKASTRETRNGIIQQLDKFTSDVQHLHQVMKKNQFRERKVSYPIHLSFQVKKVQDIDPSLMKQELEKRVKERLKPQNLVDSSIHKFKQHLKKFHCYQFQGERNKNYYVNHLSPNRNVEGFNHFYKELMKKAKKVIQNYHLALIK